MRLQLHKDFTFSDAAELVPYLVELGISHVYSSPILTARAGSIHGYDVVDPTRVNAELGGEQGLRAFVAVLRAARLGLIVDIVPNHMAVGASDNPWWTDLLRHGRSSKYGQFFDVDWDCEDPALRGKVLAPFLGKPYGAALADGEIRVAESRSGDPVIRYFDTEFPIDPADFAHIAEAGPEAFDPATRGGRERIHALLERQHYRLAWWRTAGDEINWRRFFDINGLAGLRIEVPEVFEATHATLFRLYAEGLIDGFRVDHVDGLSDPPAYCRQLRQRLDELAARRPAGAPHDHAYVVIEKILGAGEVLPIDWGVDGTSGYDFMNEGSALQHNAASAVALADIWHQASLRPASFEAEEVPARQETIRHGFDASLRAVTAALHRIARADPATRDTSAAAIRRGLVAILSHFPAYRGYDAGRERSAIDQAAFSKALTGAKATAPRSAHATLDLLDRWLGGQEPDHETLPLYKRAGTLFQQLSAPVAAKAVEDTAFYRYGRLLSRNDVGFDAARLGSSIADFHQACGDRLASFPDAMLATATHDHKRGEDVRARLAVLSEVPDDWAAFLAQARLLPIPAARPDPGDEIMLYQMIVGAWPLALEPSDHDGGKAFAERLAAWQVKALREAKLRTDWTVPDEAYEATAGDFLFALFLPGSPFQALARSFVDRIAPAGAVNGLVQAALKMTVPGMPDFYQGSEFWDFSLVDPDNRRPVDYQARRAALSAEPDTVLATWRDGRIKQWMMRTILRLRQETPELFARGDYIPLRVDGPLQDHIVAFARTHLGSALVVVAPRLVRGLLQSDGQLQFQAASLQDSVIMMPSQLLGVPMQPLPGTTAPVKIGVEMRLDALLSELPVALLHAVDSA